MPQLRAIQSGWQSEKQRLQYESAVALSNSHSALLHAQCESAELNELHDEERRVMLESLQQLVVDNMQLKQQLQDAATQLQHVQSMAAAVNAATSPTSQAGAITTTPAVASSPTSTDAAAAAAAAATAASSAAAAAAAAASSELVSLRSQAQLSAQTVQLLTTALSKIQAEKEELACECTALRRALEQEHRLRQALESAAAASAAAAASVVASAPVAPVPAIPSPMSHISNLNTPVRPATSQASPDLSLQPSGARVAVDGVEPRSAPVPNWTLRTAASPLSAGAAHPVPSMSPLELHLQLSPLSPAVPAVMRAADVAHAADIQAASIPPLAAAESSLPSAASAPVDAVEAEIESSVPLLAPVAASPLAKPLGGAGVSAAEEPSPAPTPSPESGEREFDLPAFHVSQPQSPAPADAAAAAAAAAAAVAVSDPAPVDFDRVLSSSEGRADLEAHPSISSVVSLSSVQSPGRPISPPSPSSDSPPPPLTQTASIASDSVPPGEE